MITKENTDLSCGKPSRDQQKHSQADLKGYGLGNDLAFIPYIRGANGKDTSSDEKNNVGGDRVRLASDDDRVKMKDKQIENDRKRVKGNDNRVGNDRKRVEGVDERFEGNRKRVEGDGERVESDEKQFKLIFDKLKGKLERPQGTLSKEFIMQEFCMYK